MDGQDRFSQVSLAILFLVVYVRPKCFEIKVLPKEFVQIVLIFCQSHQCRQLRVAIYNKSDWCWSYWCLSVLCRGTKYETCLDKIEKKLKEIQCNPAVYLELLALICINLKTPSRNRIVKSSQAMLLNSTCHRTHDAHFVSHSQLAETLKHSNKKSN